MIVVTVVTVVSWSDGADVRKADLEVADKGRRHGEGRLSEGKVEDLLAASLEGLHLVTAVTVVTFWRAFTFSLKARLEAPPSPWRSSLRRGPKSDTVVMTGRRRLGVWDPNICPGLFKTRVGVWAACCLCNST